MRLSTTLLTDLVLIAWALLMCCCQKEKMPHPIVGTWETIVPTYPAKFFSFNENGSACYKLDSTDFKSENCRLEWVDYGGSPDTIRITDTQSGAFGIWVVTFHGGAIMEARHLTPNPIVTPVNYLKKIDE